MKRVYRSLEDRMIAGVCGGIAERFNWDPAWVRLATVVLAFAHGLGIVLYIVGWIVIPNNPNQKAPIKTVGSAKTTNKTAKNKTTKNIKATNETKPKRRYGLITLLVILVVVASVAALGFVAQEVFCLSGNGIIVQETREVSDFDKVELTGSGTLIITQGENFSVTLETDENLLPYYETKVIGDKLEIGVKGLNCFLKRATLVARVTMPEVEKLTLYGSGDILSTNVITAEELDVAIGGSGTIDLDVNVSSLETEISGSGDATYRGSATSHEIGISGSGDIFAYNLSTEQTSIDIAGSGDAEITAYKTLDVEIAGSGDIYYKGEPSVTQSIAGSGDVEAAQ